MSTPAIDKAVTQLREAGQLIAKGRRADATLIYQEVAVGAGEDAAMQVELGQFCMEVGALDRAIAHYAVAVEREPENAHYLGFLGVAYQHDGQYEKALDALNRALAINAEISSVLNGLGLVHAAFNELLQAKARFERATELEPGEVSYRINYAQTLKQLNEHEEALEQARKAVKQDPLNPHGQVLLGTLLTESGRTDEAIRHFENTIRENKTFGVAYDLLARIRKFSAADARFIQEAEKALETGMSPDRRCGVHYALGKMYDDCKEWDEAFEHIRQANLLQKRRFDADGQRKAFHRAKKVFNPAVLEKCRAFGHPSRQPVFVVGMPRAGTTLIEQLISAHPRAAGAGELGEIPRIAEMVAPSDDLRRYASAAQASLTSENIRNYAQQYLAVLRQGRKYADRIVDKLPRNFFFLGLISILFPNATIIHAARHPLDTCLSCYFQNFAYIDWANDLGVIGEMYRSYREIMAYWQRVLPDGRILEVKYERLIEDTDKEARRLIEGCGLDWDDSVLQFHRRERVIRTASLWQARQPIYYSSKMRWKNYGRHLEALANALSDHLQEGEEELNAHGIHLARGSGMAWLRRLSK